jgi:hypothetical protein
MVLSAFVHKLAADPLSTDGAVLFDEQEKQGIRNIFQGPASGLREDFRLDWISNLADCGLFQAIYILKQIRLTNRRVIDGADWGHIFNGIRAIVFENRRNYVGINGRWLAVIEIVLDEVGSSSSFFDPYHFYQLCSFVEAAARGVRASISSSKTASRIEPFTSGTALDLGVASHLLRRAFIFMTTTAATEDELAAATAGLPEDTPPIPRIPADLRVEFLHSYVRALMLCEDHEGVFGFVRWIAAHEGELRRIVDARAGGDVDWARLIAVLRVDVDKARHSGRTISHYALRDVDPTLHSGVQGPSRELAELMYQTLVGLTELDGWATDEQVARYFGLKVHPAADDERTVFYHTDLAGPTLALREETARPVVLE